MGFQEGTAGFVEGPVGCLAGCVAVVGCFAFCAVEFGIGLIAALAGTSTKDGAHFRVGWERWMVVGVGLSTVCGEWWKVKLALTRDLHEHT